MSIKPQAEINEESNKTYPQDWSAYNQAQTQEKLLFFELLGELSSLVTPQKYKGTGRPSADISEMIFSICLKTYLDFSSRRIESDIQMAKQLGYIDHVPHFNTILKYLNNPKLGCVFRELIRLSSLPLKQIEENFTIDSSGFSTSMFGRWFNARTGNTEKRLFKKAHLFSGTRTNIITSVEITDGFMHDSKVFQYLLLDTNMNFDMKEVSADAAYSSRRNLMLVSKCGAIPYIAFKKNTTGHRRGSIIWSQMYRYFSDNKEEFLQHYHRRSNAETVFSMIKRKQGSHLKTKNDIAQVNEILAKCLVHNICVLIQEMFELGIKIDFEEIKPFDFMCKIAL
ncbi:MAG: transposase [Candidatus Hermodarchaeota archaeon]